MSIRLQTKAILLPILASLITGTTIFAADFYVSPAGSDAGDGTIGKPFATLAGAQKAVRESADRGKSPISVFLRAGTYYLPETLIFTSDDSGSKTAPVAWQAYKDETPVISGGAKLELKWKPYKDLPAVAAPQALQAGGIFMADVSGLSTDQLFVNGERQNLARYPNFNPDEHIFNGYSKDAISPERVAKWADPKGGFIHAMHTAQWGGMHYIITGKDDKGNVTYEGGWQNNRSSGMHKTYRFVENIFEELDAPGEWFLDTKKAILYFYPPAGLDLAKATVEAVRLKHLVEFNGTEEKPVRFVTFKSLTIRHAMRTFMENKEPLLRTDWTTYRGGALVLNGTEDCSLEDCFIDQVGGNAVFVNNYNRRVTVRGCHIAKAGGNGIAFIGDPKAVRSPLFEYNQRQSLASMDKEPGPKTANYPGDCLVDDCLIYLSGRVEKQTAPIEIDIARNITIRHCSIYDAPRAGINIGDGCWGGHVIEFCDIFDTVKETGDHGSFNSWGRDRYWGLKDVDLGTVTLGENKNLPILDVVKPIIMHDNRWRCDHGWDIDLDDGSSNYEIRNNLCLNGGIKNREGFYRVVENNIMVNNSFHPHVWYKNSQDVFRKNIVFGAYRPIGVNKPWGKECDFNLLHKTGVTGTAPATGFQQQSGLDVNSIEADAMFIDPAKGDYRVKDDSPALKLGFKNFPMDNFGVQKPSLKAIAKTPELPDPTKKVKEEKSRRDARVAPWLGAKLKNVIGLGEVSAAGLPGEIGVRFEEVAPQSQAEKFGFKPNDVILKCGSREVNTLSDFLQAYGAVPAGKLKLEIFRGQKRETMEVEKSDSGSTLSPGNAKINGDGGHPHYDAGKDYMGSWMNKNAWLEWKTLMAKPGEYDVSITLASPAAGNEFEIQVGEQKLTGKVHNTGGWEKFETAKLGTVKIEKAGETTVTLKPTKIAGAVMNIRSITLESK